MAFDPQNPQVFFQDASNLSPSYTGDPTTIAAKMADLQAALQWAQSNPNDPNSAYYISQITPALQEQQNISTYTNSNQQITDAGNRLKQATDFMSKYSNDQNGMIQWAKDTGLVPPNFNFSGQAAAHFLDQQGITAKWQAAYGNMQSQAQTAQQQMNDPMNAQYKNDVIQGTTFAQPNFGQAEKNLSDYWAGVKTNEVQPMQQDIYQTAYNVKNNIAEKMNLMGQMGSGAETKAQGMENASAMNKDVTLQNDFNQSKAASESDLKNTEQNTKNQYQDATNSLKGGELGSALTGAGNQLTNAFNTNTRTQLQNTQNNFDTNLLKQQQSDKTINGLGSSIGGLGGTLIGGLI